VRRFKLLYLAPAFALIALMAWAFASPAGSSPDDDFHLASIWCANSANTAACEPAAKANERVIPPSVYYAACFARDPTVSAGCQAQHDQGSVPSKTTKRGSFENNYPPVFYATMSVFVGGDLDTSILLMRLANVVLLVGIGSALFVLLPRRRRPALLGGWILTTVPLGLFLLASNNPSSWALIGVGSAWLALLGFFETVGVRRILLGALFVLSTVLAAGSRGDAALYIVVSVGIVFILVFDNSRRFWLGAILPAVMSLVAIAFFFSSRQATVAVSGLDDPTQGGSHVSTAALLFKDFLNVPSLWVGSFGTWPLGWLDTGLPALVPFAALTAFVVVVLIALNNRFGRKSIALVLIVAALWIIPTYVLVAGGDEVGQNVQPRYLLPLIVLGAGVAMLGLGRQRLVLSRTVVIVAIATLTIAESLAMYINMRRYITGIDSHDWNLDANVQWWWHMALPPMAVLAIGSLAYLALLITLARELPKNREIHAIDTV
jgi:hypothetical protein